MLPSDLSISITVLVALLGSCAAQPVDVHPAGKDKYTLRYFKQPIDTVPHMRRQLTHSALEICRGEYREMREYPDPMRVPSRQLTWDIECGKT